MADKATGFEVRLAQGFLQDHQETESGVTNMTIGVESELAQMSLQELAVTKSMEEILDPDFKSSDFTSLEPRLQQLLFEKLRGEVSRLKEEEKHWSFTKRHFPSADRHLYTRAGRKRMPGWPRLPRFFGRNEETKDAEDAVDVYIHQDKIIAKWCYASKIDDEDDVERLNRLRIDEDAVDWSSGYDLVYVLPDDKFAVWSRKVQSQNSDEEIIDYLFNRISSQLLQYRITVMFGMIPPSDELDGYKQCWQATLVHWDTMSCLELFDYKGAVTARFHGTVEGSTDALELLDYLCGNKIPHSYDGALAGTAA